MNISICIATYRRPVRLAALLDDLVQQQRRPDEVVVVDNDASGSARAVVVLRVAAGCPFPIRYAIQPVKNISITRNRSVALASGDWLAFIDDDERAEPRWLDTIATVATGYAADGALGPVEPVIPHAAPAWIRRGGFYRWARMATGTRVPVNKLRFGNVLLRAALLREMPEAFDPAYGLTGGEDGDLLVRLVQAGAHIVWCDEAVVLEPVEASRLSMRWLLLRALRGGQDYARHRLAGRHGHLGTAARLRFVLRALGQAAAAALLAVVVLPAGRHHSAAWLVKLAANIGKLSMLLGWHYHEYGHEKGRAA